MEVIKFDRIVSVTSEIQGHTAQNLLDGGISPQKNWMCEKGTEKAILILQLERAAILLSIHIGNAHSAFVEVLVGKAADSTDQFESLIPMSSFMNPHESKTGSNPNRTRFFNKSDFNEGAASKAWDRIKVVCSQPFNKHVPYGLCFLKVHGEKEEKKAAGLDVKKIEEDEDEIKIGSFFKKKRNSYGNEPLSVSEQMKEAEKESSLGKHTPISISKISAKMSEKQTTEKKPKKDASSNEKGEKRKKLEEEKTTPKKQKVETKTNEKERKRSKEEERKEKKEEKKRSKEEEKKVEEKEKRSKEEKKEKKVEEKKKKERRKMKPFEKLMEDVVLVISGFKNPLRGNIRSLALEMGARYSGDWESHCTHLVCAYMNTPKFNQVKGKGKIVTKKWVEKCHEDRKRYPWRRFALDRVDLKQPESEEEIEAGEEEENNDNDGNSEPEVEKTVDVPSDTDDKTSKSGGDHDGGEGTSGIKNTSPDPDEYDAPTDEENDNGREDTTDYPMPYLPNMFSSKTFYVDPNLNSRSIIERYITAYNGVLADTFNEKVEFYITDRGGPVVETFREEAPNMIAVKPSWIWEVNSKQKWIPTTSHLVH